MEKDYMDEKHLKGKEEPDFKNEYVENSMRNEASLDQLPPTGINESYESNKEPNGLDPETIFEKGYSFQETPEEIRSQKMNQFGKEPNGINPDDRKS
ncbi:hypothetical protein M3152_07305 [Sporosarcina luteola]|uniref:hypothetical protein n=1 Tax=Sporosarcina luteola TaxID=582850 RepID=UPI002041AF4F|nr:hypothetical protein [Sporosarcina luteola]MCM3637525.1 hypothetical protein [Sporosarcina luteola]